MNFSKNYIFTIFILLISNLSFAQNSLDNLGLTVSTPSAVALSLRKLSSSYTGNAIMVRRSTDNAEATVSFDANSLVSASSNVKLTEGVVLISTLGSLKSGTISTDISKTGTISVNQNKTGTISFTSTTSTITGIGTQFIAELSVGDVIYYSSNEIIGTVLSITDNSNLIITGFNTTTSNNVSFRNMNASVVGVGTSFLTELSVGSRIFNSSNTYLGTVKSISSNTQLDLNSYDAVSTSSVNFKSTSNTVTGVGTSFLTQISIGDMIVSNNSTIGIVQSISNNSSLTLTTTAGRAVSALAFRTTASTMNFSAFYASSSVLIKTWYDQSGNGRDLIQRTAANQPRIVNAGIPLTLNSRIAVQFGFSGTSSLFTDQVSNWLTASYTLNKVTAEANLNPSNMNSVSTYGGNGPINGVLHFGYRSNNQLTLAHYGDDMNFNSVSTTDLEIHTAQFLNIGSRMYRNTGLLSVSNNTPSTNLQNPAQLSIGLYRPTNTAYNGFFTEFISFATVISDEDRVSLENNQLIFYAIDRSVWTGAVNNDWNNASNWIGNVPTLTSPTVVVIPNVTNKPIITATTAYARSLTIETGATVTITSVGILKMRGTINGPIGNLIATEGTLEFDGSTGLNVPITLLPSVLLNNTIGNLVINTSNNVALGTTSLIVKNNITFTTGKILLNGLTLTLNGTITNNISQGIRGTSNSNLILNCSANSTLSLDQTTDGVTNLFNNVTVNTGANTVILGNKIQLASNLTIQSGILDVGAFSIDRTSVGGTLQVDATGYLKIGGTGTLPANYSTHVFGTGATVEFSGSNQTIPSLNSSQNYGNLTLSGSGTKTLNAAINVVQDTKISSGVKMGLGTFTNSTNGLFLAGSNQIAGSYGGTGSPASFINATYFAANTGVLNVNSNQLVWTGATSTNWNTNTNWSSNAVPLINQDVTIPASATNQPLISASAVCRNLTLEAGTTLGNNSTLTISGNLVNNGCTISGTGTMAFNGVSKSISGTSSNLLNFSIASGGTISIIGNHIATSLSFTGGISTSSLTHSGASTLIISGTVALQQPTANSINHSWNINNGTATVGGLISYSGTNTTITRVQEIVITNGILNANGGITFAVVNNSGRRIVMSGGAGRINMKGALTLGGTQTLTSGNSGATFSYSGTSPQTINYFISGSYYNFEINNLTNVTLGANLTSSNVTGNLSVISGTLKNGSYSIAGGATRTFSLANGTNLFLSGTAGFPSGFGYTVLADNSVVEYNSPSAQTIGAASYYDLTLAGARTTNSITIANSGIIEIRNSFTQSATFTSGGFIATGSTVKYSKNTATQTVAEITYNNLWLINNSQKIAGGNLHSSDITIIGNLTISSGDINFNSKSIDLKGNLVNNSNSLSEIYSLNFNGATQQSISGSVIPVIKNATLNGAEGLKMDLGLKISQNFDMQGGNIFTSPNKYLEIGTGKTNPATLTWTKGNVVGPVKRWFAASTNSTQASGIFPVGNDTLNRMAQINFTSAPEGGYIIAEFVNGLPPDAYTNFPLSYSENSSMKFIQNADEVGYWNMIPYNENDVAYGALDNTPYNLVLRLNNPTSVQNGGVLNNPPGARLIRAKGSVGGSHSDWELAGDYVTFQELVAGEDYKIISTNVVGFSWFGIGGNNENPLPIELESFVGNCEEETIKIVWRTASEHNTDYFNLEKLARNEEDWDLLAKITAAGNSNELLTYTYYDNSIFEPANFYRLIQVDLNGLEKIYGPIEVDCNSNSNYFKVYSDPNSGQFHLFLQNENLLGESNLFVLDSKGSIVLERKLWIEEGMNFFIIDKNFQPGFYFLRIENGIDTTNIEKQIKN